MLNVDVLKAIVEGKRIKVEDSEVEDSEVEHNFCCPRCGSCWFGSDMISNTVQCHDEFSCGCHWSGPREGSFYSTYSIETLAQEILNLYQNNEK